jgi:flagellin
VSLTVNTNLASLNATTNLNRSNRSLQATLGRISSGMRINKAGDDAAGLAVSENLDADGRSIEVAKRNTNDGISIIQTAEGATAEVGNILKRMRELAVQSSSDTLANSERAYIDDEYDQLNAEIGRIANVTEFNGVSLTDGTPTFLDVQVGINNTGDDRIQIALGDLSSSTLGVNALDMSTAASSRTAIDAIDGAIETVSGYRSQYGSVQNRLESAMTNLEVYGENLRSAYSRIRDADFATESAEMSKKQIMQQAGVAVLSQASSLNQGALRLIG